MLGATGDGVSIEGDPTPQNSRVPANCPVLR